MKNLTYTLIVLISFSCKKEVTNNTNDNSNCSSCNLDYPEYGINGINLLHGNDTLKLSPSSYSFRVNKPESSSVKIVLKLIEGNKPWQWINGTNVGWSIQMYSMSDKEQYFDAISTGPNELKIIGNGPSTIHVDYYENSISVTKQKVIIFE
jgi:hypothetical protein